MKDRMHSWRDMPDDLSMHNKDVIVGCGGHGLRDNQYAVSIIQDDMSADIYVFPDIIGELIKWKIEHAIKDKIQEIHRVLRIT